MKLIKLLKKLLTWLKPNPVIMTQWGPVTEAARHRAALNMREDLTLREQVVELVVRETGGDRMLGEREARRRYPEAFEE
jgi:hypothetical protein